MSILAPPSQPYLSTFVYLPSYPGPDSRSWADVTRIATGAELKILDDNFYRLRLQIACKLARKPNLVALGPMHKPHVNVKAMASAKEAF
ncbi:hypothetical protein LY76DRAFT_648351 [Colletotrichum caudatum]|nr:hypothetical protein LY76DRAFT_648351 [Colletotrichum caudatum]